MFMSQLSRLLSTILLLTVAGCGPHVPAPIEPAPPNEFLSRFVMLRLDRGKSPVEISDEIQVIVNTGFVAQFKLDPSRTFPEKYFDRTVVLPEDWSMMVTISPRDRQQSEEDTIYNPVCQLHATHRYGPVNRGGTALWTECGLTLEDTPKGGIPFLSDGVKSKEKNLSLWTYICGPKDLPGEYVYEVQLLPTGAWLTAFRSEYGEPVVLRRGLLRVLPLRSEQTP
jgi:hypothetical protein